MDVHVIVFTPPLEKFDLTKWQWHKEKSLLFKIYNTSSSFGWEEQSVSLLHIYKESFPAEWAYQSSIQLLSCYALIALLSQFNMHVSTHGATKQTNGGAICNPERRIAITISATSHCFTHLFFCIATAMENSLISM